MSLLETLLIDREETADAAAKRAGRRGAAYACLEWIGWIALGLWVLVGLLCLLAPDPTPPPAAWGLCSLISIGIGRLEAIRAAIGKAADQARSARHR